MKESSESSESDVSAQQGHDSRRFIPATLLAIGIAVLIWYAAGKLDWRPPGLGFLTAKTAVFGATGIVGLVVWLVKRR
ncbi:hypothetical protein SSP35_05_00980 [Streptomyces sp. NBRC 110611]|uniref:hypothetical protein n=1 Tax=Streptomyces sp. NBRC 110611 TaxID=1621259 RepID=UPI00082A8324|nr:hypothetical protein [Streptomyces sp. NBRC 110611]GAU67531.1 hypothetical protein SSP35_05_00980 [Streptomyces sp. NBRC 110611]